MKTFFLWKNKPVAGYFLGTVKEDHTPLIHDGSGSRDTRFHGSYIVIHHYVMRSWEEAAMKSERKFDAWQEADEVAIRKVWRGWNWFQETDGNATDVCLDGLWYAGSIKSLNML